MKITSSILQFLLIIILNITSSNGQSSGDFQTHQTGDLNNVNTWERYDGSDWVNPAPSTPTSSDGVITILSGDTVTVTANVTVDQVVVNTGGILETQATLTIADGTGTDLVVNGLCHVNDGTLKTSNNSSVQVFGTMRVSGGSGSFTAGTNALLSFEDESKLEWNRNSGNLYPANRTTWHSNSTLEIIGTTNSEPGNIASQSFGNVTWNSPGQTGTANLNNNLLTVTGNYKFISTGTGMVLFSGTGGATYNVTGNFEISGGTVAIASGGTQILNVAGNFIQSGGSLDLLTGGTGSTSSTVNVSGNYSQTAGSLTRTGGGSGTIVFNGSSNQSYTSGGTVSNTIDFTVNNPSGVALLTSVTIPAGLTMTNGDIELNGNILTLGTSPTSKGTLSWSSGFITGTGSFTRWFSTSAVTIGTDAGLFPIGSGTDNRSVWLGGTPSTGGTVSVQHTDASGTTALSFNENLLDFDKRTNMSWTLSTANGFAGSSFSLRIKGSGIPGINAVGDLNISLTSGAAGGSYSSPGGTTSDPQVNRTGLTAAELGNTFYFAATSDSPLPVELTSFSAVREDKSVILYWITETEVNNYGFEILRTTQDDDKWEVLGFVRGHGNSNSPNNYTFIDNKVGNTGKCYYKLKMIDNDGTNEFSKTIEVNFNFPISFELRQNYPNPFNPNTKISWQSPVPGLQNLKVYDIMGKEVATLVNEYKQAGNYEIEFDGTALASGVYFYKLSVNNFVSIKKMILLR